MSYPQLTGDEMAMAEQIYRLHQSNGGKPVDVTYNSCIFNINFNSGEVLQQFIEQGAVKSRLSDKDASPYADKIKVAHSFAADIYLLDYIKSIKDKDKALEATLDKILNQHQQDPAGVILKLLAPRIQASALQSFSMLHAPAPLHSSVLDKVRVILNASPSFKMDSIGKAQSTVKLMQAELEKLIEPSKTASTVNPNSKAPG